MTTLVQRAWQHVQAQPDKTALIWIDGQGEKAISYDAFFAHAAGAARALETVGVQQGDLIILVLEQGETVLYGFWGALLLGAVPSIFPYLTEKLDPARYYVSVRELVARSGARVVITSDNLKPPLETALAGVDVTLLTMETPDKADAAPYIAQHEAAGETTAFLQHSSGSTGLQKGVMLSHRAVLNQVEAYGQVIRLTTDDVIVSWLPLYHDMGLIAGFIMPLVSGVTLVLMSPFQWVRKPEMLLHAIHRHRGTLCWLPNFAYNFLATRIRPDALAGIDLSSWRAAINCSEPVYAESHRVFLEKFASYGFQPAALATCYAMAENTFAVTQSAMPGPPRVDEVERDTLLHDRRALPASGAPSLTFVSCGKPIPDCEVRIVDEAGNVLPERCVGEIAIRSNSMLNGYYKQPELSAKALREGWYHTGDMGYLADGELYITGRKKDLIIVGGKNIYPQDIENLLNDIAGLHPGRAVAFGVFNDRLGTEDVALVAEADTDDPEAQAEIMREIRSRVAQTLDVAVRYVHLVDNRWLIKTSSGKVARTANREKFLSEVLQMPVSEKK